MTADSKFGRICERCGTASRDGGAFCPDCGSNIDTLDEKGDLVSSSKRIVIGTTRKITSPSSGSRTRGRRESKSRTPARPPLNWTSIGTDGAPDFVIASIFTSILIVGIFLLAFLLR